MLGLTQRAISSPSTVDTPPELETSPTVVEQTSCLTAGLGGLDGLLIPSYIAASNELLDRVVCIPLWFLEGVFKSGGRVLYSAGLCRVE